MPNDLTTFNLLEPIFVDANILEGNFPGKPFEVNCKYFLKRIEEGHVKATTSVRCINEALYKRLMNVGKVLLKKKDQKVRETIEKDKVFAKACYAEVKIFSDYLFQLKDIGLYIIDYTLEHQFATVDLAVSHNLTFIFTDATYLYICRDQHIRYIATADNNFNKNPFQFEIWQP